MPIDQDDLRNAGPSRFVVVSQFVAARAFGMSRPLRRKLANVGEIADYVSWGLERFSTFQVLATREEVWELLALRVGPRPLHGIEFGVAWGYSTGWWLQRLEGEQLRWDGFDRFTGLPREWRGLKEGHFDAGGVPPAISDQRVTWHVGDVEDRLSDLDLARAEGQRMLILFDLDVFEPSESAWEYVRDSLRPGDLLYFDEAFDSDERHLLEHLVLPSGHFEFVGATPLALALQVIAIHPRV